MYVYFIYGVHNVFYICLYMHGWMDVPCFCNEMEAIILGRRRSALEADVAAATAIAGSSFWSIYKDDVMLVSNN